MESRCIFCQKPTAHAHLQHVVASHIIRAIDSFKKKRYRFTNFMLTGIFLHTCLCNTCMPGTLADEKRESDSLEVELLMVAHHRVTAGKHTDSYTRAISALNLWAMCPAQAKHFNIRFKSFNLKKWHFQIHYHLSFDIVTNTQNYLKIFLPFQSKVST